MKNIIDYKIFENITNDLLELIWSDIEELNINPYNLSISSCDYKIMNNGEPIKDQIIKCIDYDVSFFTIKNVNFSNIKYKSEIITHKNSEVGISEPGWYQEKEVVKYKSGIVLSDNFREKTEIDIINDKIFNSLNRERFLSYGFNFFMAINIVNRKVIVFYKNN